MYEPEVNDYVIWERESWTGTLRDEGWVYFKCPPMEEAKGFTKHTRYITIETGVKDKPVEQLATSLHKRIHTLLLCYEHQWKDLKFVKKRKSSHCQHYSQYDDVN